MEQNVSAETLKGKVIWFDDGKGFGFIERPGHEDVYVHFSGIASNAKRRKLIEGQRVKYELIKTEKGFAATNVEVVTG